MSYYIFLDFDGVLATQRTQFATNREYLMWHKLDPIALGFLNAFHRKYQDVYFVMNTTWKNNIGNKHTVLHIFESMLCNAGFEGTLAYPAWKTNPADDHELWKKDRAFSVKHYIQDVVNDCEDFIIFDDTHYRFNDVLGVKRFIRTHPEDGITTKNMKDAMSMAGNWRKR